MELIPILSLIILVATISTFILAIGAYILYKIRERKGVAAQAAQPAALPAELIAPAPLIAEQRIVTPARRTFETQAQQQEYGYEYQRQPPYTSPEDQSRGPELRPTFVGGPVPTPGEARYQRPTGESARSYGSPESERTSTSAKRKYMRYTNEGYVEPSQQEKKQEDNLRWR
ncbi:MAG: hypothetical protein AB1298_05850 [Bacteroidota bacterium]